MSSYSLRRAHRVDFPAIKELIHLGGINPMGLNWKRFIVAATPDGEIIGCGQIKPHGEEVLELASIAVTPAHRNQGVARAIIEQLLAESPRPLYLMCRSRLEPLYEKFGFRAISYDEMPRYFRSIARLAGWAGTVVKFGEGEGLSVMKLQ